MAEVEEGKVYHFFPNFDAPRKIADLVDVRGAAEGAVLFLPCAKLILSLPVLDSMMKTSGVIVSFGLCMILGGMGINGEYLSEFIIAMFKHARERKLAFYNPRIKLEATPDYLVEQERRMLPRERIQRLLGRNAENDESIQKSMEEMIYEINYQGVYFADDIGVVEKPEALKTRKEIRDERKEEARKKREASEELKREEKKLKKRRRALARELKKQKGRKADLKTVKSISGSDATTEEKGTPVPTETTSTSETIRPLEEEVEKLTFEAEESPVPAETEAEIVEDLIFAHEATEEEHVVEGLVFYDED